MARLAVKVNIGQAEILKSAGISAHGFDHFYECSEIRVIKANHQAISHGVTPRLELSVVPKFQETITSSVRQD